MVHLLNGSLHRIRAEIAVGRQKNPPTLKIFVSPIRLHG